MSSVKARSVNSHTKKETSMTGRRRVGKVALGLSAVAMVATLSSADSGVEGLQLKSRPSKPNRGILETVGREVCGVPAGLWSGCIATVAVPVVGLVTSCGTKTMLHEDYTKPMRGWPEDISFTHEALTKLGYWAGTEISGIIPGAVHGIGAWIVGHHDARNILGLKHEDDVDYVPKGVPLTTRAGIAAGASARHLINEACSIPTGALLGCCSLLRGDTPREMKKLCDGNRQIFDRDLTWVEKTLVAAGITGRHLINEACGVIPGAINCVTAWATGRTSRLNNKALTTKCMTHLGLATNQCIKDVCSMPLDLYKGWCAGHTGRTLLKSVRTKKESDFMMAKSLLDEDENTMPTPIEGLCTGLGYCAGLTTRWISAGVNSLRRCFSTSGAKLDLEDKKCSLALNSTCREVMKRFGRNTMFTEGDEDELNEEIHEAAELLAAEQAAWIASAERAAAERLAAEQAAWQAAAEWAAVEWLAAEQEPLEAEGQAGVQELAWEVAARAIGGAVHIAAAQAADPVPASPPS